MHFRALLSLCPASQGGQFLRAVAERCQHLGPRMHTLVTMGAQRGGWQLSGAENWVWDSKEASYSIVRCCMSEL